VKILVCGSIGFDYLMSFSGRFTDHILPDHLDRLSVSFLVDTMVKRRGGIAANIAYTLALLGERPLILGAAGGDFAEYRAWLDLQGVDTSSVVEFPDLFTASFFVSTDVDGNQIASFYTGAMSRARELSIAEQAGGHADLSIISPDDPVAMVHRVEECKALEIPYIYDPSQQIVHLNGNQLANGIDGCLLLIVNEYEFHMILDKTGWTESEVLKRAGSLITTLGKQGSHMRVGEEELCIPVVQPTRVADPTGVGDAFRAGLIRGYSLGVPWSIAGRMGSLAAAYVLEQVGTQSHYYTRAEFVSRFREHFDDRGALNALLD
jgi:adenosine kinase